MLQNYFFLNNHAQPRTNYFCANVEVCKTLPIGGPFTTFMETKDVVEKPCGISNLLVAAGTKLVWKNPFATFYWGSLHQHQENFQLKLNLENRDTRLLPNINGSEQESHCIWMHDLQMEIIISNQLNIWFRF